MDVLRALVVEDDVDAQNTFRIALEVAGFTTTAVESGTRALSCLARERPDVVVLGLHLPDMTGAEILQRIRADERLAGVPVIVATARPQMAKGLEEEADLVLVKPVLYNEPQERAIEPAHGRGRML